MPKGGKVMSHVSNVIIASALMFGTFCAPEAAERHSAENGEPYRLVPRAAACFCPSDHTSVVISSRAQLETILDAAPCTSRGEGAEERAEAWSERCWRELDAEELDFDTEALLYLGRFFTSGMITGSLEISPPEDRVLPVEIVVHRPDGPLTPDLGFKGVALAVDKSRIRQIRTDDGRGNPLVLDVD